MTRVRSGSASLAVTVCGVGPDIVLLHAGVNDRRAWTSTVEYLSEFRTITYDRREFGETTYEPESHSWTDDLDAILNAFEIDRCVLVGNSQGGRIALDYALAFPNRVTGLVLIGTAVTGAPAAEPTQTSVREITQAIDEAETAGDIDEVNRLETRLWLDGPDEPEGRVGGAIRTLFLDMNGGALRAAPAGEVHQPESAWERLELLNVPVTVVVGKADLRHIRERSDVLASRISGAQLVEFEGLAHNPHLEQPKRCADLIRDFVHRVNLDHPID